MISDSGQKYIVVKGAGGGGLGDRIRCVLAGIAYAKLTARTLFIDWSDGKLITEPRNVFNQLFSLSNIDFVDAVPLSDDVWPQAWQGRLEESLHTLYTEYDPRDWDRAVALKKFSFDQRKLDYSNQVLVMWDFDQFTDLAKLSEMEPLSLCKVLAQQHLRPSEAIGVLIDDFKSKSFFQSEQVIGVHIRATNEFDLIKSSVRLDQYIDAIRVALKKFRSSVKIFLATDNVDVISILEQTFPGKIIVRDKWFARAGERLHFNDDCPEPEQALFDAMVEMLLLAECDYLIYQQNSSFGRCAHIYAKAPENNIIPLFVKKSIHNRIKNKVRGLFKN